VLLVSRPYVENNSDATACAFKGAAFRFVSLTSDGKANSFLVNLERKYEKYRPYRLTFVKRLPKHTYFCQEVTKTHLFLSRGYQNTLIFVKRLPKLTYFCQEVTETHLFLSRGYRNTLIFVVRPNLLYDETMHRIMDSVTSNTYLQFLIALNMLPCCHDDKEKLWWPITRYILLANSGCSVAVEGL